MNDSLYSDITNTIAGQFDQDMVADGRDRQKRTLSTERSEHVDALFASIVELLHGLNYWSGRVPSVKTQSLMWLCRVVIVRTPNRYWRL